MQLASGVTNREMSGDHNQIEQEKKVLDNGQLTAQDVSVVKQLDFPLW